MNQSHNQNEDVTHTTQELDQFLCPFSRRLGAYINIYGYICIGISVRAVVMKKENEVRM